MTVKKKMDLSISSFIDKGAEVRATRYSDFKNILIRVPVVLLNEIDRQIVEKPWINRTHWIVEVIFEKLNSDEDDG